MSNLAIKNLEKLKQGFLFWNKYRASLEGSMDTFDFSNLQFEGELWRHNELKNAELRNSDFTKTVFRNIDFLNVEFNGSDFSDASFYNVHFTNCIMDGCLFKNAVFNDVSWYYTNFKNIHFTKTNGIQKMRFYKCSFPKNSLEDLKTSALSFEECQFDL